MQTMVVRWTVSAFVVMLLAACGAQAPAQAPESPAQPGGAYGGLVATSPASGGEEASVTVADQDASTGRVVIDRVVSPGPGWLVIHVNEGGAPSTVIGFAAVQKGVNTSVSVEIDLDLATDDLFAMLHQDVGSVGVYEFPGADTPVQAGGAMVNVPFRAALSAPSDSVTVAGQDASNGTVTVDRIVASQAGWIVIHTDANGSPGPVIGYAEVPAGVSEGVQVTIDAGAATATLHAMLHVDAGVLGTYEFPGPDAPALVDGAIVNVPFTAFYEDTTY